MTLMPMLPPPEPPKEEPADDDAWEREVAKLCASLPAEEAVEGDAADAESVPAAQPSPSPLPDLPTTTADERRRCALEVGVVLALAVLPYVVSAGFSLAEYGPRGSYEPTLEDSLLRLTCAVQTALPLLYLHARSGQPWAAIGLRRGGLWTALLGGVLLWGVLRLVFQAIWRWLPGADELLAAAEGPATSAPTVGPTLQAIGVVATLAGVFAEELAIRGFLFDRLERWSGRTGVAILWSAAAFASHHVYQGMHGLAWNFIAGLVYATVFAVARRLGPLVVAHALWNLVPL